VTAPEKVWGLVLAGGKSTRMGTDKASLIRGGETQLARAVALLNDSVERVFISTRAQQSDDPLRRNFERIVDKYENLGPIAGILSAMDENPSVSWLVLACDLPNVDATTIEFLLVHASAEHPATAYRSVHDGLPEPLCAIYRPEIRATIDDFVARGFNCPRKILINSPTLMLEQSDPDALHNVNSPGDLAGTGIELPT